MAASMYAAMHGGKIRRKRGPARSTHCLGRSVWLGGKRKGSTKFGDNSIYRAYRREICGMDSKNRRVVDWAHVQQHPGILFFGPGKDVSFSFLSCRSPSLAAFNDSDLKERNESIFLPSNAVPGFRGHTLCLKLSRLYPPPSRASLTKRIDRIETSHPVGERTYLST